MPSAKYRHEMPSTPSSATRNTSLNTNAKSVTTKMSWSPSPRNERLSPHRLTVKPIATRAPTAEMGLTSCLYSLRSTRSTARTIRAVTTSVSSGAMAR